MNSKKLMLVAVLAAILVVGWLAAVKASTSTEIIDTQNALVAEADALAAKELYVRAIPKYTEALQYKTDNNAAIQAKLLESYYSYGQGEKYTALVEARVKSGTAAEAEIHKATEIYLDSNQLEEAVALLVSGIELTGGETLVELYEDNRYYYRVRNTSWTKIIPTADNSTMPATDGKNWYYVDNRGKQWTGIAYESATPANGSGFSVVKLNGTYYAITSDGSRYGIDETGLEDVIGIGSYIIGKKDGKWSYYNPDFVNIASSMQFDDITLNYDGCAAVKSGDKWGVISDNGEMLLDYTFEDVALNSHGAVFVNGAGMVKHNGLWYLATPNGGKIIEQGFADAKAPESADGLIAVANDAGKWGFIDRTGALVIDYQYDDAKSFSQHLAAVKDGRTWGYISERGELVIDLALSDAQPFRNGIAQGIIQNEAIILELELTEN